MEESCCPKKWNYLTESQISAILKDKSDKLPFSPAWKSQTKDESGFPSLTKGKTAMISLDPAYASTDTIHAALDFSVSDIKIPIAPRRSRSQLPSVESKKSGPSSLRSFDATIKSAESLQTTRDYSDSSVSIPSGSSYTDSSGSRLQTSPFIFQTPVMGRQYQYDLVSPSLMEEPSPGTQPRPRQLSGVDISLAPPPGGMPSPRTPSHPRQRSRVDTSLATPPGGMPSPITPFSSRRITDISNPSEADYSDEMNKSYQITSTPISAKKDSEYSYTSVYSGTTVNLRQDRRESEITLPTRDSTRSCGRDTSVKDRSDASGRGRPYKETESQSAVFDFSSEDTSSITFNMPDISERSQKLSQDASGRGRPYKETESKSAVLDFPYDDTSSITFNMPDISERSQKSSQGDITDDTFMRALKTPPGVRVLRYPPTFSPSDVSKDTDLSLTIAPYSPGHPIDMLKSGGKMKQYLPKEGSETLPGRKSVPVILEDSLPITPSPDHRRRKFGQTDDVRGTPDISYAHIRKLVTTPYIDFDSSSDVDTSSLQESRANEPSPIKPDRYCCPKKWLYLNTPPITPSPRTKFKMQFELSPKLAKPKKYLEGPTPKAASTPRFLGEPD